LLLSVLTEVCVICIALTTLASTNNCLKAFSFSLSLLTSLLPRVAHAVSDRPNSAIAGSNHSQGAYVFVRVFPV